MSVGELLKVLAIIALLPIVLAELIQIGILIAEVLSNSIDWLREKRGNSHED